MDNKIDVVYVPTGQSKCNYNEVRFVLRSIEKYVSNVRRVYVIGKQEIGDIIAQGKNEVVQYLKAPLPVAKGCSQNTVAHDSIDITQRLIQYRHLTHKFIFITDDTILTRPFNHEDHNEIHPVSDLEFFYSKNSWHRMLINTYFWCLYNHDSTHNYESCSPVVYNTPHFSTAAEHYLSSSPLVEDGLSFKSVYGNLHCCGKVEYVPDVKTYALNACVEVKKVLTDHSQPWICVSADAMMQNTMPLLFNEFSEKSIYEG